MAEPAPVPCAQQLGCSPLAPLELVRRAEAADPRLRVGFVPWFIKPGQTLLVGAAPRVDAATGQRFVLGFNQMALDPVNGTVQGTRDWGALSLSRENLLAALAFGWRRCSTRRRPTGTRA
ncbi:MAG: hypothetical protein QM772_17210 [Ottowia sp.]|uniref:hypothetical protein n=1 Tax=Ottowia sp. TaxID=1898956 RepID=UPI0039E3228F